MAETAPAPAAAPAKTARKKSAKAKKSGPSVSDLIVKAVAASNERKGVSLAALKKALAGHGYDVEKNNSRVKLALKSLVQKGTLVQTKGTGASGSFKVGKAAGGGVVAKKPVKKAVVKVKKAATPKKTPAKAAKPKKVTTPAKKPAAKKAPKKVKKPVAKKATKSPKKSKKAAVKKVTKSPKKVKAVAKPKASKPKATKTKKAAKKK